MADMQYFVIMIDYGRRGREAIVDPEVTRREVISRVASGEYKNISFIHEIADSAVEDVTADILAEAALRVRPAALARNRSIWPLGRVTQISPIHSSFTPVMGLALKLVRLTTVGDFPRSMVFR